MKNKKGFTLIELLAVIVILAIIALISVPIITNVISSSQKKAAIDEAYVYIDAVESNTGLGALDKNSGYLELEDICYKTRFNKAVNPKYKLIQDEISPALKSLSEEKFSSEMVDEDFEESLSAKVSEEK